MSGPASLRVIAEPRPSRPGALPGAMPRASGADLPEASLDVALDAWRLLRPAYLRAADLHEELRAEAARTAPEAPVREVALTALAGEDPLVLDDSLAARLIDLYIVHGWSGITRAESAVRAALGPLPDADRPGGVVVSARAATWAFFRTARAALERLVATCLADLERRVARTLRAGLDRTARRAKEFGDQLGLRHQDITDSTGPGVVYVSWYVADNETLLTTLHQALLEAAEARARYDRAVDALTGAREELRRRQVDVAMARNRFNDAPRPPNPYLTEAADQVRVREKIVTEAAATARVIAAGVQLNAPLGLLALPSMTPRSTADQTATLLGGALDEIRSTVAEYAAVGPGRSRVADLVPTVGTEEVRLDELVPGRADDGSQDPGEGPEERALDAALDGFAKDRGRLALLHERNWSDLVESGEITRDSFSFAVHHHYSMALGARLAARSAQRAARAEAMRLLAKAAAAASLVLLLVPPAGVPVRAGLMAADLVLTGHALSAFHAEFESARAAIAEETAGVDGLGFEAANRIAELCAYRRSLIEALPQQILAQLLTLAVGEIGPLRSLLLARSYYNDIRTVFG